MIGNKIWTFCSIWDFLYSIEINKQTASIYIRKSSITVLFVEISIQIHQIFVLTWKICNFVVVYYVSSILTYRVYTVSISWSFSFVSAFVKVFKNLNVVFSIFLTNLILLVLFVICLIFLSHYLYCFSW